MTRRRLIQEALLILECSPAWLFWVTGCVFRQPANAPPASAILESQPKDGPLSTTEMEELVAFGEALVTGRTLAPAERRYLVEHIEDACGRSPDYLLLYRTAAGTLDHLAGHRFCTLEIHERIEFIARHRLAAVQVPGEQFSPEIRALRTRVAPDLIRAYYTSPAGWAVVGYETFPGRCGDLTRYTRPDA